MSNDTKKKSIKLYLACLIAIGVVLNLGYKPSVEIFKNSYPTIHAFLISYSGTVEFFGLLFFSTGLLTLIARKVFLFAWDAYLKIPFNEFNKLTDKHLANISDNVVSIGKDFDKYIKKRGGPLSLHECKTTDDYKEYLRYACGQIYGTHIHEKESLYHYLKEKILDPFNYEPYLRDLKRTTNISDYAPNPEYSRWNEIIDYDIHHLLFPQQRLAVAYDIRYRAVSYAPDMSVEKWVDVASLIVRVNSETIVSADTTPTLKENDEDEGYYCWKKGEWIFLRYLNRLTLEKEKTHVTFEEKTINFKKDKTYTLHNWKPVYNYYIDFTLPKQYIIQDDIYIGPRIAIMGLPTHIRQNINLDDFIIQDVVSPNRVRIEIKDWMMPGVIFTLNWLDKNET